MANRKKGEAKDRKKKAESREKGGGLFFFDWLALSWLPVWSKKQEEAVRREPIKKKKGKGSFMVLVCIFFFLPSPFLQSDKGCNMLMLNAIVSIILEEFVSLILFFYY